MTHEGYGGKKAEFLAGVLEMNFRTNVPDTVLVHAGHNHTILARPGCLPQ